MSPSPIGALHLLRVIAVRDCHQRTVVVNPRFFSGTGRTAFHSAFGAFPLPVIKTITAIRG